MQGLAGYENEVKELEIKASTLGNQVLPSLRSEILSGKKPPYEFKCTMVRTDINNFSSIFANHDTEKFMGVINEFFTEVSHIVSRYRGYVHEFVGDEVIYYFKDEECPNSRVTALSAIRDINSAAERFSKQTQARHGYPFTVKSSLAHGKVRFGHLVNGFTLAGSVLIETVRILSHVIEKDGNVVCFEGAHITDVTPFCDVGQYGQVALKGLNGQRTLYRYLGHHNLSDVLKDLNPHAIENLTFYRSDDDLRLILRHLRSAGPSLSDDALLRVIRTLRDVTVTRSGPAIAAELMNWLESLASNIGATHKVDQSKVFSAACMLVINLVTREHFSPEYEARLSKFLKVPVKRVVANVLDVLTHFKAEADGGLVRELTSNSDGRVAANALVFEGSRGISPETIKRLRRMLGSSQTLIVSSGLYALGELAHHHRTTDLVYYNAQVEFQRLVQDLPRFVTSDDVMVRRQSLIAARKAGDPRILEQIHDLVAVSNSISLREAAHEYLGLDLDNVSRLRKAA
jgi:class 3 adenylate cyclase